MRTQKETGDQTPTKIRIAIQALNRHYKAIKGKDLFRNIILFPEDNEIIDAKKMDEIKEKIIKAFEEGQKK